MQVFLGMPDGDLDDLDYLVVVSPVFPDKDKLGAQVGAERLGRGAGGYGPLGEKFEPAGGPARLLDEFTLRGDLHGLARLDEPRGKLQHLPADGRPELFFEDYVARRRYCNH